ncbi:MAG: glycosyltransferase family 39 protein [Chloroflexi bacterium]|nr:glycosyltransferase family 39 protein [Chloroflexota bacterium]
METEFAEYHPVIHAPLYPIFLAFIFNWFGEGRFAAGAAQALLDTGNIALVYALSCALFKRRGVGLVAAALYALYPEVIGVARLLYSEVLFIFFANLGTWLLLRRWQARSTLDLVGAGLCFAVAALAREILAYFVIVVVPLWIWITFLPQWRKALVETALIWLGVAFVLAPWVGWNWSYDRRINLISSSGDFNLLRDNVTAVKHIIKLEKKSDPAAGATVLSQLPKSRGEIRRTIRIRPTIT